MRASPNSPTATSYTLSHKSTEMQETGSWSLMIFLFSTVFSLCSSLGTREGDPPTAGAGPGCCGTAVALLWHCCHRPGWHPPGRPALLGLGMPGTPCSSMVFICFVATARPTSEAGRETWPISHWVGSREGESGSLWGPLSGRGSTLPHP